MYDYVHENIGPNPDEAQKEIRKAIELHMWIQPSQFHHVCN